MIKESAEWWSASLPTATEAVGMTGTQAEHPTVSYTPDSTLETPTGAKAGHSLGRPRPPRRTRTKDPFSPGQGSNSLRCWVTMSVP